MKKYNPARNCSCDTDNCSSNKSQSKNGKKMLGVNTACPSGFPEFSPAEERVRQTWMRVIREVFEQNGFLPIETPLVEREENLVAKGGNPKEIYVLKRLHDDDDKSHSGNAVRFDHTVPLALYVARHFNELAFPFRRYVIGPVMRGERAQKGRFRQFDQCDIDVIGMEHLSLLNDALMPAIIIQIFEKLQIGDFKVRINNRKLLVGIAKTVGVDENEFIRILDEQEKVGKEKSIERMKELRSGGNTSINPDALEKWMEFRRNIGEIDKEANDGNFKSYFLKLKELKGIDPVYDQGVQELEQVFEALSSMGVDKKKYRPDINIARGLDYYTGTVFETVLLDNRISGSICAGGRYDDLAEIFTGKKLPGVGISIGLTRLLSQLFEAKILQPDRSSPTEVLVIATEDKYISQSLELATEIRGMGFATENYLEGKKLDKQFSYADKLGIPACVVLGENEVKNGTVQVKDMRKKKQEEVKAKDLESALKKVL
ncbi:histidine--tRNA ligase [Candidatus Gracilibacteria bacterium]|nr:histidine--tRNA ligase [Candidatus Gracilibacteria bacterium]